MPKRSRHHRALVLPGGEPLERVSLACAHGDCLECPGKVAVPKADGPGREYVPCECRRTVHIYSHLAEGAVDGEVVPDSTSP